MWFWALILGAILSALASEITINEKEICPYLNQTRRTIETSYGSTYIIECSDERWGNVNFEIRKGEWVTQIVQWSNVSFGVGHDETASDKWIELEVDEESALKKYTLSLRDVYIKIMTQYVRTGLKIAWKTSDAMNLVAQLDATKVAIELQVPTPLSAANIDQLRLHVVDADISQLAIDYIAPPTVESATQTTSTTLLPISTTADVPSTETVELLQTGEACSISSDCGSMACAWSGDGEVCCSSQQAMFSDGGYQYCAGLAPEGENCPTPDACEAGLTCRRIGWAIQTTCQPKLQIGEDCWSASECNSAICASSGDRKVCCTEDAQFFTAEAWHCKGLVQEDDKCVESDECDPALVCKEGFLGGSCERDELMDDPNGVAFMDDSYDDEPLDLPSACHADYYTTNFIDDGCISCPPGSTSFANNLPGEQSKCTCKRDYYSTGDATEGCKPCGDNSYSASRSILESPSTCKCMENFRTSNNITDGCIPCDEKTFLEPGSVIGVESICKCKENFRATNDILDGCVKCGDGEYLEAGSNPGEEIICKCKENFRATNDILDGCVKCDDGGILAAGSTPGEESICKCRENFRPTSNGCVACDENAFLLSGSTPGEERMCQCRSNFYATDNILDGCISCEPGSDLYFATVTPGSAINCTCKTNFHATNDGCKACPPGTTRDGGSAPGTPTNCSSVCMDNYYTTANIEDGCLPCPGISTATLSTPGTTSNCTCPLGFHTTSDASDGCIACRSGTKILAGSVPGTPSTCVPPDVYLFRNAWSDTFRDRLGGNWKTFIQNLMTKYQEDLHEFLSPYVQAPAGSFTPPKANTPILLNPRAEDDTLTIEQKCCEKADCFNRVGDFITGTKCFGKEKNSSTYLTPMLLKDAEQEVCKLLDQPVSRNMWVARYVFSDTVLKLINVALTLVPTILKGMLSSVLAQLGPFIGIVWKFDKGALVFSSMDYSPKIPLTLGGIRVSGSISGVETLLPHVLHGSDSNLVVKLAHPVAIMLKVVVGNSTFPLSWNLTELSLEVKPYLLLDECAKSLFCLVDTLEVSFVEAKIAIDAKYDALPPHPLSPLIETLLSLLEIGIRQHVPTFFDFRSFRPTFSGNVWKRSALSTTLQKVVRPLKNCRRKEAPTSPLTNLPQEHQGTLTAMIDVFRAFIFNGAAISFLSTMIPLILKKKKYEINLSKFTPQPSLIAVTITDVNIANVDDFFSQSAFEVDAMESVVTLSMLSSMVKAPLRLAFVVSFSKERPTGWPKTASIVVELTQLTLNFALRLHSYQISSAAIKQAPWCLFKELVINHSTFSTVLNKICFGQSSECAKSEPSLHDNRFVEFFLAGHLPAMMSESLSSMTKTLECQEPVELRISPTHGEEFQQVGRVIAELGTVMLPAFVSKFNQMFEEKNHTISRVVNRTLGSLHIDTMQGVFQDTPLVNMTLEGDSLLLSCTASNFTVDLLGHILRDKVKLPLKINIHIPETFEVEAKLQLRGKPSLDIKSLSDSTFIESVTFRRVSALVLYLHGKPLTISSVALKQLLTLLVHSVVGSPISRFISEDTDSKASPVAEDTDSKAPPVAVKSARHSRFISEDSESKASPDPVKSARQASLSLHNLATVQFIAAMMRSFAFNPRLMQTLIDRRTLVFDRFLPYSKVINESSINITRCVISNVEQLFGEHTKSEFGVRDGRLELFLDAFPANNASMVIELDASVQHGNSSRDIQLRAHVKQFELRVAFSVNASALPDAESLLDKDSHWWANWCWLSHISMDSFVPKVRVSRACLYANCPDFSPAEEEYLTTASTLLNAWLRPKFHEMMRNYTCAENMVRKEVIRPVIPQAADWMNRTRWAQWKGTRLLSVLFSDVLAHSAHADDVRNLLLDSAYHNSRALVVPVAQREANQPNSTDSFDVDSRISHDLAIYSPSSGSYVFRGATVMNATDDDLKALAQLMDPKSWTLSLNASTSLAKLPRNVAVELLQIHVLDTNAWHVRRDGKDVKDILRGLRIDQPRAVELVFAHSWNARLRASLFSTPLAYVALDQIAIRVTNSSVGRMEGPVWTAREDVVLQQEGGVTYAYAPSVSQDARLLFTPDDVPIGSAISISAVAALVVSHARLSALNGFYTVADGAYRNGNFTLTQSSEDYWMLHGIHRSKNLTWHSNSLRFGEAGHWPDDSGLTLHKTVPSTGNFAEVAFGKEVISLSSAATLRIESNSTLQILVDNAENVTVACKEHCLRPTIKLIHARSALCIRTVASSPLTFDVINAGDTALGARINVYGLNISVAGTYNTLRENSTAQPFEVQLSAEDLEVQAGAIVEMFSDYLSLDRDQRGDPRCKAKYMIGPLVGIHKLHTLAAGMWMRSLNYSFAGQKFELNVNPELHLANRNASVTSCMTKCAGAYTRSTPTTYSALKGECIFDIKSKRLSFGSGVSLSDCGLRIASTNLEQDLLSKFSRIFITNNVIPMINAKLDQMVLDRQEDTACPPREPNGLNPEAEAIWTSLFLVFIGLSVVCAAVGMLGGVWCRCWNPSTAHALPNYGALGSASVIPAGVGLAVPLAIVASTCSYAAAYFSILGTLRVAFRLTDPALEITHTAIFDRKDFVFWKSIDDMYESHVPILATILAICSGILPFVNSVVMLYVWLAPPALLSSTWRGRVSVIVDSCTKFTLLNVLFLSFFVTLFRIHVSLSDGDVPDAIMDVYVRPDSGVFLFLTAGLTSIGCAFAILTFHCLDEQSKMQSRNDVSRDQVMAYNTVWFLSVENGRRASISSGATGHHLSIEPEAASRKFALVSFHTYYVRKCQQWDTSMSVVHRVCFPFWSRYVAAERYILPVLLFLSCVCLVVAYFVETLGATYGGVAGYLMHSEAVEGMQSGFSALAEEGNYVTATRLHSIASLGTKMVYNSVYDMDAEDVSWRTFINAAAFFLGTILSPLGVLAAGLMLWFVPTSATTWHLFRYAVSLGVSASMFTLLVFICMLELVSIENIADHLAGYSIGTWAVDQLFGHLFQNKVAIIRPYYPSWLWFAVIQCIVAQFCVFRLTSLIDALTATVGRVVKDPVWLHDVDMEDVDFKGEKDGDYLAGKDEEHHVVV